MLFNPNLAYLITDSNKRLPLKASAATVDYKDYYVHVAVRQAYLNDTDETQNVVYKLPSYDDNTIFDFQTIVDKKISGFNQFSFDKKKGDDFYLVNLGEIGASKEIVIRYIYTTFIQPDNDWIEMHFAGDEEFLNFIVPGKDKYRETFLVYLHGIPTSSTINSPNLPMIVDLLGKSTYCVARNDDIIFETLLSDEIKKHKNDILSGKMDIEDIAGLVNLDKIFATDTTVVIENISFIQSKNDIVITDRFGELFNNAIENTTDYLQQYICDILKIEKLKEGEVFPPKKPKINFIIKEIDTFNVEDDLENTDNAGYIDDSIDKAASVGNASEIFKLFKITSRDIYGIAEKFENIIKENSAYEANNERPITLDSIFEAVLPKLPFKFSVLTLCINTLNMEIPHLGSSILSYGIIFDRFLSGMKGSDDVFPGLTKLVKDAIKDVRKGLQDRIWDSLSNCFDFK